MSKYLVKRLAPLFPQYWTVKIDKEPSQKEVSAFLNKVVHEIPFYQNLLEAKDITNINLNDFPIIRKQDIVGKELELVSPRYPLKVLRQVATGGTTGVSLNIYKSPFEAFKECRYFNSAHSIIAPWYNRRVAVLRGDKPQEGIAGFRNGLLILSAFDLNEENAKYYLELLEKHRITTLHVYPSAISLFCKYIKAACLSPQLPNFKGVLSSSEILSAENISLVHEVFPSAKVVDLYGQNEHVAFALSVDQKPYRFFNSYGITEFIDAGIEQDGNRICEIVSTGFINRAMPLVRYGTEDYVAIDDSGNVVSIIGRSQDFIVNHRGDVAVCMLRTRDESLKNVIKFQFFQDKAGTVEFRVVVNDHYGDQDKKLIEEDFVTTYGETISAKVVVVDELTLTSAGKLKRLIQKLDVTM